MSSTQKPSTKPEARVTLAEIKALAEIEEDERKRKKRANADEARRVVSDAMKNLDDEAVTYLAYMCEVIKENVNNAITPIENFIVSQAHDYVTYQAVIGRAMTPDDIARDLEECRGWFDDAITITRKFRKQYASVVDKADAQEAEDAATEDPQEAEATKEGPIEPPDWLETPEENFYRLSMEDPGGETDQNIKMTRQEFMDLKLHLAKLRGISTK